MNRKHRKQQTPRVVDATWVCLRTAEGKLLARFNPPRGVLEIRHRGTDYVFTLQPFTPVSVPSPPPPKQGDTVSGKL